MQIDFFGDLSCPWCHLGWRRLKSALATRQQSPVTVRWRPFQLNPDIPVTGIDRTDYLLRKFGNVERVREVQIAIETAMKGESIAINMERIRVTPHTYLAHRLMLLAEEFGKADELMSEIFAAYFVEGLNIGDPMVLQEIAFKAGISQENASKVLSTHAASDAIAESEMEARQLGIKAVPYFLFERKYSIAGAHDPVAFSPLLDLCILEQSPTEGATELGGHP